MAQNQSMSMSVGDLGLSPQTAITSQNGNMATPVKKKKPAFNYGNKSPAAGALGLPQTLGQLGGTPLR